MCSRQLDLKMEILPRMFRCKNIPLFGHSNMGIYLGNVYRAVPKHFLDVTDVHIRFQQACSESMAEHMRRNMHFYSRNCSVLIDHPAYRLVR